MAWFEGLAAGLCGVTSLMSFVSFARHRRRMELLLGSSFLAAAVFFSVAILVSLR